MSDENIHIGKLLGQYLRRWRIYVPIGLVCLAGGILFLMVTPRRYTITSTMQLLGEKEGMASELKMLKSSSITSLLGGSTGASVNMENEIALIGSREVLGGAIKDAGAQIVVSARRGLKRVELDSEESPLRVSLPPSVLDTLHQPVQLSLEVSSGKLLKLKAKSKLFDKLTVEQKELPCVVSLPIGAVTIERGAVAGDGEFRVKILPLQYLFEKLTDDLYIRAVESVADVVMISEDAENVKNASRLLNALMARYNSYSREVRVREAGMNADFVGERLDTVAQELAMLEYAVENYKLTNRIPDEKLYATATYYGDKEMEKAILERETELRMLNYLTDYMSRPENEFAAIPVVEGVEKNSVAAYNALLVQRQSMLLSAKPGNPSLTVLESQIAQQRKLLTSAAIEAGKSLKSGLDNLYRKERSLSGQVDKMPSQEREYIALKRQQKIKESVYLFLMQKLQEKEIANSPDEMAARVVDPAYSSYRHVFPRTSIILAIALLIAVIVSLVVISLNPESERKQM
jgi:uncharacterized protein involved in exopolysaccharide biosynthesis